MLILRGFPMLCILLLCSLQANASSFLQAAFSGDLQNVKSTLDGGGNVEETDRAGNTALIISSFKGHNDIVQYLIDKGANVNAQAKDGFTALIYAAQQGRIDTMDILITNHADINMNGLSGTALYQAVEKGQFEAVQYLVDHNADLNSTITVFGLKLNALCQARNLGREEIYDYLKSKGAKLLTGEKTLCKSEYPGRNGN